MNIKDTIIIAHRGACAYAPENTIAAFQKAVAFGADGIEFDVKLSRDGELIIIHDQTVDRTTNGTGKVKDLTKDDLRQLDAGSSFSPDYKNEKIPLLKDVLENFSDKLLINIELTNYSTISDGLAHKTALLVKELRVQKSVFFSSFHPKNLLITKKILPDVPVALLAVPGKTGWLMRSNLLKWVSPQMIHPYYKDIDKKYIDRQHQQNRKVNIWTVNNKNDLHYFVSAHVDGIITDDPILAKEVIERS